MAESLWDPHSPQPCWGPGSTEAPPFGLRKCPISHQHVQLQHGCFCWCVCALITSAISIIHLFAPHLQSNGNKPAFQLHLSSCKCHSTFPTCHTFREEQWLAHWQAWGNGPFGCHFLTIHTAPVDLVEILYFKKQWVAELPWCFNKFSRKHLKKKKKTINHKTKKKNSESPPPFLLTEKKLKKRILFLHLLWIHQLRWLRVLQQRRSQQRLTPFVNRRRTPSHLGRKMHRPKNGPPEAGSHAKCHERDHAPPVADTFRTRRQKVNWFPLCHFAAKSGIGKKVSSGRN